ncbi:MAG: Vi polysaccharide biosynthesis protein VipB/TviC [Elusimicrobia bacterium RIFCSPLOWO2_01_FULL_59_12]|nr:MAG: Vi polysaccharide biosynthesis protein VipB/TviC [Elusimicrobia bacterium RIFCSPLOWO2_01_FULL_59_12]
MKCLVTGGAGFIGSHIAEALIRRGDAVRVFDNLTTGKKEHLASVLDRIEFLEGDLRRAEDLARAVRGIEVVFHQAALRSVPRSVDDPASTNDINITGTLQLLMACRAAGVKRLVYASSSSVYGDHLKYPQTESMRTAPISPYAVSKLAGENYCVVFAKTFGLETVSLRYFNVFGPRQHPESQYAAVIPKFMQSALRGQPLEVHWDGKQSRDFTYIDNVVQANLLAASASGVSAEAFNIASGKSISLLHVIAALEKSAGRRLERRHTPPRSGDVRKTWADIRKAKKRLRYQPRIDFAEGLRRTWAWFQKQPLNTDD